MPLQWVDPDMFLVFKGVTIYYTYRYDNYDSPYKYWFSTDIWAENPFDIRDIRSQLGIKDTDKDWDDFVRICERGIEESLINSP